MRVLLADDHALFKEGLSNLLRARGIDVVGSARDGLEALDLARALRPDIVLMDIGMPHCDGIAATRLIRTELPAIKIIMLTTSAADDDLFEAIKSGASGYLLKSLDADTFFSLLSGVMEGDAALSPMLATRILREFSRGPEARPAVEGDSLTDRQIDVLQKVVEGLTYKAIADALFITERTVKYHMREILQKLHLRNRSQAIAYALRTGLVKQAGHTG